MGLTKDKQALQAWQIASMIGGLGQTFQQGNPGQLATGAFLTDSAQGAIAAQNAKIARKKAEAKAKKGGIGKLAGTAVGAVGGFAVGGPAGAAIGSQMGGGLGGGLASGNYGQAATAVQGGLGSIASAQKPAYDGVYDPNNPFKKKKPYGGGYAPGYGSAVNPGD